MTSSTERMRRLRERQRDGWLVIQLELDPEVLDALETAYLVEIASAADAAAVLGRALARWAAKMDRLAPRPLEVTRHRCGESRVVDRVSTEGSE